MAQYIINNVKEDIPFEDCTDEVRRVIQNAKNLILTQLGEVPFDRLRGFDRALYNLPFEQFRAELPKEIDRVLIWEPRCKMVSATAEMLKTPKKGDIREDDVVITVVIDVIIE